MVISMTTKLKQLPKGRTCTLTLLRCGYIFPDHEQLIDKHIMIMPMQSFTKTAFIIIICKIETCETQIKTKFLLDPNTHPFRIQTCPLYIYVHCFTTYILNL